MATSSSSQSNCQYIFLEVQYSAKTLTAEQVVGFLSNLKYHKILVWSRSVMLRFASRNAFADAKNYCEEEGKKLGLIKIKTLQDDFTRTTDTEIESTAPYHPGLSTKK